MIKLHDGEWFTICLMDSGGVGMTMSADVEAGEPKACRVVFDGSSTMLMFRNNAYEPVVFDNLSPSARKALSDSSGIYVVEIDDDYDDIVYSYKAPIIHVEDVKPYMCLIGDDPDNKGALIIPINEKQMEEAEAAYIAEKQANFDRLIDKLMKVLIQT